MREQMACKERKGKCSHVLPGNIVYKDVVVIGNGPSGLCTSYMLSGWLPNLAAGSLQTSDEMLTARLSSLTPGQCLLDADLSELAEGLEGRSHNPVPLLMDNLQYPCADMGLDLDPLLEWRFHPNKKVDHIVLGSGPAGGAWHTFASKVLTLSPARWLSLPPHRSPLNNAREGEGLKRAHAQAVADYYRQYVRRMGLQKYFRSDVVVQHVRRVRPASPYVPCLQTCPLRAAWCVQGYELQSGVPFTYVCGSVVLACGSSDLPQQLPATACPAAAVHNADAPDALDAFCAAPASLPVVVVGSGLSAADAIVRARSSGASVLHVYHKAAVGLRDLSPSVYPEYHQVYQMMCKGTAGNFERYTALPEHEIQNVSFLNNLKTAQNQSTTQSKLESADLQPKLVKFLNTVTNVTLEKTVSLIFVLIGSRPNLNFLSNNLNTNLFDLKINERTCKNRKFIDRTQMDASETLDACCENRANTRDGRSWTLDVVSEWNRDRVTAHTDTPENVIKSHNSSEKADETSICVKCAYNNNTSGRCFNANTLKNKKKIMKKEFKSRWSNLKQVQEQGYESHMNNEDEIKFKQIDSIDDSNGKENVNAITHKPNFNKKRRSFSVNDVINCDLINGINNNESDNVNDSCNGGNTNSINGRCRNSVSRADSNGQISHIYGNKSLTINGSNINGNDNIINENNLNSNGSCTNCNSSYINDSKSDRNETCINVNESDSINDSYVNGKINGIINDNYNNGHSVDTKSYIAINDDKVNEFNNINGIIENERFNGFDINGFNGVLNENEKANDIMKNNENVKHGRTKASLNLRNSNSVHEPPGRSSELDSGLGLGLGYGLDPLKPIDCRSNPINIDRRTHQVRNVGKGLFALGPLTGDNFVRFIPGGALAIVSHMWKESKNYT